MTHLLAQTETRTVSTNKRGALCTALLTATLVVTPFMLSSCGFHLRGYDKCPATYMQYKSTD